MKLNSTTIRNISKALNAEGWRGYFKELGSRVNLDTGYCSVNVLAVGDHHDLDDKRALDEWRGADLDMVNGVAEVEVWTYDRNGWLGDVVSVYLVDIGRPQPAVLTRKPDQADILRAAVAFAAR